MSLTRGKGLKQHDLTPFFRIPITVIRVDAVLCGTSKAVAVMRAVSGRAARRFSLSPTAVMWMGASAKSWGSSLRTILHRRSNTTERRLCATAFLRSATSAEGRSVPSGWVNFFPRSSPKTR